MCCFNGSCIFYDQWHFVKALSLVLAAIANFLFWNCDSTNFGGVHCWSRSKGSHFCDDDSWCHVFSSHDSNWDCICEWSILPYGRNGFTRFCHDGFASFWFCAFWDLPRSELNRSYTRLARARSFRFNCCDCHAVYQRRPQTLWSTKASQIGPH